MDDIDLKVLNEIKHEKIDIMGLSMTAQCYHLATTNPLP